MKAEFGSIGEMEILSNEALINRLAGAHTAIRMINKEIKDNIDITQLQNNINILKEPYKQRIQYQKQIISAAEIVAQSRDILREEKLYEDS